MSIYEAYQMDSPLNEQFEYYPLTPHRSASGDPVQQRMMFILGFVAVVVITAVILRARAQENIQPVTVVDTPQVVVSESEQGDTAVNLQPAAGKVSGSISAVFSPQVQHWGPQIVNWASQYNLDPDIVATIMQIESCGDPQAGSHAGAQGLFQVMPFHFTAGENMLDPDTNARRGMAYYAERLQQTGGDIFQAFAGYNGGHVAAAGNWNTWANETQRYYTWGKGIYEDAKSGSSESTTLQQWMQAGGASLCQQASARLNLN